MLAKKISLSFLISITVHLILLSGLFVFTTDEVYNSNTVDVVVVSELRKPIENQKNTQNKESTQTIKKVVSEGNQQVKTENISSHQASSGTPAVGDLTSPAKLISKVQANRTDAARKAGYTGTATVLILIDQYGQVQKTELLNQLEYGLNDVALELSRKLQFLPAKIKDQAVSSELKINIHFKSTN